LIRSVACEGAPRDVGLDQGRACAEELRARFAAQPWWVRAACQLGRVEAPVAELRRQLARHFPHQNEMLAGIAVGARVPVAALLREIHRELGAASFSGAAAASGAAALLARQLAGPLVVRHSRPEGLFAALEATRPWLCGALAGVNERGLAVVALPTPDDAGRVGWAALLGQDCLERFETLDAALEWCASRPAGGRAVLLLGDATGEVARVSIDGDERRVRRPAGGLWAESPSDPARLAKILAEAPPANAEGLAACLGGEAVAVDVAARRLWCRGEAFSL
jgi:hypothetical protein